MFDVSIFLMSNYFFLCALEMLTQWAPFNKPINQTIEINSFSSLKFNKWCAQYSNNKIAIVDTNFNRTYWKTPNLQYRKKGDVQYTRFSGLLLNGWVMGCWPGTDVSDAVTAEDIVFAAVTASPSLFMKVFRTGWPMSHGFKQSCNPP